MIGNKQSNFRLDLKIVRFTKDSAESEGLTSKQEIMCSEPYV